MDERNRLKIIVLYNIKNKKIKKPEPHNEKFSINCASFRGAKNRLER
jgi:hypothetical protein